MPTKNVAVSIKATPCDLGTTVTYGGIEVAFIQGTPDDLKHTLIKSFIRAVFEGYSLDTVKDTIKHSGIMRLNHDDFAR